MNRRDAGRFRVFRRSGLLQAGGSRPKKPETDVGYEGVDQVTDPARDVFRALQLSVETLAELAGRMMIWKTLPGRTVLWFGFGRILRSGPQMPAAFLIRDGRIVTAYRHRSSAERVNLAEDVCGHLQIAWGCRKINPL